MYLNTLLQKILISNGEVSLFITFKFLAEFL